MGRYRLQSLYKHRNQLRSIEFDKSTILMMMMVMMMMTLLLMLLMMVMTMTMPMTMRMTSFFSTALERSLCGNQRKTPKNSNCRERHSSNMQEKRRHWRRRPRATLTRRQTRSPRNVALREPLTMITLWHTPTVTPHI